VQLTPRGLTVKEEKCWRAWAISAWVSPCRWRGRSRRWG